MEIERDVKPQPAGDSEATWSPGPRTTTKIPHFADEDLKGLAEENEQYGDIDLQQVSDSIDSVFGKLPEDSTEEGSKPAIEKSSGASGLFGKAGDAVRASGALVDKLGLLRS